MGTLVLIKCTNVEPYLMAMHLLTEGDKLVFSWQNLRLLLTLRLHYVPGDHGNHGSPKRSAPCDLVIFCLGTQVLLSIITFRHGL